MFVSASFRPRAIRSPRVTLLAALLALPAAGAWAQTQIAAASKTSDEVVVLEKVEITEKKLDPLGPSTAESSIAKLSNVAGGTSYIDFANVSRGRVGTGADILAFTPGVFATPPAGGGDGIKISARGSGIARSAGNFFRNGVLFTFDGIPVTGPGGTPYELFETYGLKDTEVFLGGNAFDNGSLALGGHINYRTKTGYDAKAFEGRLDLGSFDYRKYQISSGQVKGDVDYFVSVTSSQTDGYQDWSRGSSEGFAGNFGYRFSDKVSNRTYLRYRTTENENPGNISLRELDRGDTDKASPDNKLRKSNRIQPGSTWIGNTTTILPDADSKLEISLLHHNAPIDIQPNPSPGNLAASGTHDNPVLNKAGTGLDRSLWNFRDVYGELKYTRNDEIAGHSSESFAAFGVSYEYDADVNIYANNPNITSGARQFGNLLKTANYNDSTDASFRLGNKFGITEKLRFDTGLNLAYIRRAGEITYFDNRILLAPFTTVTNLNQVVRPTGNTGKTIDNDDYYLAPRVGLLYTFSPGNTLFANVTRSIEAPNSWQLSSGSTANIDYHLAINNQDALAYEVGTRLTRGAFSGGLTVYHTDVKDELLTVLADPSNPGLGNITFNGPDTYKQGVEFNINTTLWSDNGFLTAASKGKSSRLNFLQALTWNRFGYKDENVFASLQTDPNGFKESADELPGVPDLNYQARLSFDHSSGFFIAGSAFYASTYYADFSNALEVPSYLLFDLRFGYAAPSERWEVGIDLRNLTDEAYAASAGPIYTPTLRNPATGPTIPGGSPTNGTPAPTTANPNTGVLDTNRTRETRTFQAGDGRAVYGYVTVRF